jgi:activator of HSP90 ATPase
MKTRNIKIETVIKNARPGQVYEILMDSKKHADLTGSPADISRDAGGGFNIYDGYITGKNIELVQDKKIVQEWRAEEDCWPQEHFSILSITLEKASGGTKLVLEQEKVPQECADDIEKGWHDFYLNPLKNTIE